MKTSRIMNHPFVKLEVKKAIPKAHRAIKPGSIV